MKASLNTARQVFEEQIAAFSQRMNLVGTQRYDDLRAEEHYRAFAVAGAMKADLLADLHEAVRKAVVDGGTIQDFRKDFDQIVARRGWHGWTGEGTRLGEAWRTRVIYQTNTRKAYSAGRYAQLTDPDMLAVRPYWRWVHSGLAKDPRPEHLAWHGMTLRHDDPFWQTHFPPRIPPDYGCSCRVVATRAPDPGAQTTAPDGWERDADPGAGAPPQDVVTDIRTFIEEKRSKLPRELALPFSVLVSNHPLNPVQALQLQPQSIDDYVAAGRTITSALPDPNVDPATAHAALLARLSAEVGTSTPANTVSQGAGAALVKAASTRLPDSWTTATDAYGPLSVKSKPNSRGWSWSATKPGPGAVNLPDFGLLKWSSGLAGAIVVRSNDIGNAVHEYAHRLQAALPDLDAKFQELHRRRTAGESLQSLKALTNFNYPASERARPDKYINPYQGKEYASGGALEVMTVALEYILGVDHSAHERLSNFKRVYNEDREMYDFVVGLLFHWKP
jgi:hypothetical protein